MTLSHLCHMVGQHYLLNSSLPVKKISNSISIYTVSLLTLVKHTYKMFQFHHSRGLIYKRSEDNHIANLLTELKIILPHNLRQSYDLL